MPQAELNQKVDNFTAQATSGQVVQLSAFNGKNIVLYFYPKDSTPGCTIEANAFRDHYQQFSKANTVILGVSRDSLTCHEKFKNNHHYPFELISDIDEQLCNYFDVIKTKSFFGKKIRGIVRSTFLIDKHAVLRQEWRKVKVLGHAEEVLKAAIALD